MARVTANRPIQIAEAAVVRTMLLQAPVAPGYAHLVDTIESLRVIDRCACGCDSVDFAKTDSINRSTLLADGIGLTPKGGQVGVIVWGRVDAVTGLEVYDLGAGDDDIRLPVLQSIRPFGASAV